MDRADDNMCRKTRAFDLGTDPFRILFEAGRDPIFIVDSQTGAILDANPAAVEKYGYTLEELLKLTEADLSAGGGDTTDSQLPAISYHRKKNGHIFPVEIVCGESTQNDLTLRSCLVRDVSANPGTFEILQNREQHYQQIIAQLQNSIDTMKAPTKNSTITMFTWRNEEGWPIEFVSENICIYGYSREDFESGTVAFSDIVHPEDLDRVAAEVYQFTRDKLKCFSQEYRICTKGGEIRWVRDHTFIRSGTDGSTQSYHGILLDITDSKNTSANLGASKPQLQNPGHTATTLDNLAHDLNNMFTSILGNTELILRDVGQFDNNFESLQDIKDTTIHAAELCNGVLCGGHIAGSGTESPATVKPAAPTEPTAPAAPAEESAPPAAATETPDSRISEIQREDYESVHLPLEDDDDYKKIPAEFIDDQQNLTGEAPLSYDHQLLDEALLDDSIRIDPKFLADALPVGINPPTPKTLQVPSAKPKPLTVAPPETAVNRTATTKPAPTQSLGTILVAEDEDSVRELACKLLGRLGFSVLTANNGPKAIDVFRQNAAEISAVLLDVSMPYLDGDKVLAEMKRIRNDVKAIICSGYSQDMVLEQFTDAQPAGFLQKPYQIKELADKLHAVLEKN